MYAAARSASITLKVNSGFRTMSEQQALYKAYKNGTGHLAAKPGFSNHQGGTAVDVNVGGTGTSTYKWMAAHAKRFGFVRTVPSEPWHWEFRP
jgi:LAS superfamily LD-carboxypeptidase LdcB